MWKKEKMLATSIFSFSCIVFYSSQEEFLFLIYIYFVVCKCFQFGQSKNLLFGKVLGKNVINPFTRWQNYSFVQFESICRWQFHYGWNGAISVWFDIKSWKRTKCWMPAISFFPQCFQKNISSGHQKVSLTGKGWWVEILFTTNIYLTIIVKA